MNAAPVVTWPMGPPKATVDFLASILADESVRLLSLDTRNPHGGRGGSIDSDQCAWLVRELARSAEGGLIVVTRHRSTELCNARTKAGCPPRILRDELIPLLLAHPNILGWIGGHRHAPAGVRHGVRDSGLWEVTPAMLGFGCNAWLGYQRRHAIRQHERSVNSRGLSGSSTGWLASVQA